MRQMGASTLYLKMELTEYEHDPRHLGSYLALLKRLYAGAPGLEAHLAQTRSYLDPKNPFFNFGKIRNFLINKDGSAQGHCCAIIDNRNPNIGLLGFFDCIEDAQVSKEILERAINWLKSNGCSAIRGPVNLTIWHPYRFISHQERETEFFDPFSKPYYLELWKSQGFAQVERYVSAVRTDFDFVISPTKKAWEHLQEEGVRIREFDLENADRDLRVLLDLANDIFSESWNFVKLSFEEFRYLYLDILPHIDPHFIEIAEDTAENPLGFCFSLPNPYRKDQIIVKTLGVLEASRRKNIAAALLYSLHTKARAKGYKEAYYPLIRVGNDVHKFPFGGYHIITEYATFERL